LTIDPGAAAEARPGGVLAGMKPVFGLEWGWAIPVRLPRQLLANHGLAGVKASCRTISLPKVLLSRVRSIGAD
jgi:hypothetical protein